MNVEKIFPYYYSEGYDPDAIIYFNQTGVTDWTFKNAINWAIKDWKATGNWPKIDRIFWFGIVPSSLAARTSIKFPTTSDVATENAGLTYINGEWYKGNAAGYLNLKYNPVDDGVNYTQNNAGFTILPMRHNLYTPGGIHFGVVDGTYRNTLYFDASKAWSSSNSDENGSLQVKTAGVFSIIRTNSTQHRLYRDAIEDGTSPYTKTSSVPTNKDFYGLARNSNNLPDTPSSQPIGCIIIHSGDIDVSAMNNTIKGIISRLNGGYKMTAKSYNVTSMNQMDSNSATKLSETVLGVFGGYDITQTFTTTDKWWTSTDGITFTNEGVMPTKSAHMTSKLRDDGFVWTFGVNPVDGKHFCWKLNVTTKIWTVVNGDLQAGSLVGLSSVQWGFFHNNDMYWALSPDSGVTNQLWKSSNGITWTYVSALANYAINASAYSDGTVIRYTGGGDQLGQYIANIYESTDSGVTWNVVMALPAKLQSIWPSYFKFNNREFIIAGRNLHAAIYEGGIYVWDGTEWKNTLLPELSGRHSVAHAEFGTGISLINGFLYNDSYVLSAI